MISLVAQPPCARNVTVTVAATTAPGHVKAADIVVTGKNMAGETITESFKPTEKTPQGRFDWRESF